MTIRYDEVLGPLREAYDGGASWRDGLDKEQWKLAERQAFRERLAPGTRLLEIGAGTGQDSSSGDESEEGPLDDDRHVPPRFFSWRTDQQLLAFAADAGFDVVDFHSVDTDRGYRFQPLTLRRPDGNPDGTPDGK